MTPRKKILMIIPNLDFGGAQKSFSNLNQELARHHDIYVAVFNTFSGIDVPIKGELIDLQIPAGKNILSKIYFFIKRVLMLRRYKKGLNIETSISFLEGADYVNIFSRISDQVIISIRGSKLHDENIRGTLGYLRKHILIPWLYNKANCIVTVNESIKRELSSHFGITSNIIVIPNFYDFEQLDKLALEKISDPAHTLLNTSSFKIASIGRLAPEKGYQHLLKVMAMLKEEISVKLYLIGEGSYKSKLVECCLEYNLKYTDADRHANDLPFDVCFFGYDSNPVKYAKYIDLFVLSSSAEGFPNAMLEMMSQEVLVAGTDCEGIRELLITENQEFGALLPTFDKADAHKEWGNIIKQLIKNPAKRKSLGASGKLRAKMFDKDLGLSQWLKLV